MHRPPRPRMMNNFHRGPMPYQNQWRPRGPPRLPWNNPRFGPPIVKIENQNSEEHWCETCDRGFPSADLLEKHKQQHQKCNIDGCQFIAHPKVITKHIQMQHSTGLYKKIANLNNPEEIQKWREERKKKYPTKLNIEKKEAEQQEKIARGEKMNLNRDHRNHRKTPAPGPGVKRKLDTDKRNHNPRPNRENWGNRQNSKPNTTLSTNTSEPPKKKKIIPAAPATIEKNKLKPFAGILGIEMDDNGDEVPEAVESNNQLFDDDDDATIETPKETSTEKPVLCGALTSLMCDYGSSDEEMEEKENEAVNKLVVPEPDQKEVQSSNETKINAIEVVPKVEKNDSDGDDAPEEVKIEKTNVEHDTAQEPTTKNKEKSTKCVIPPKNVEKPNYKTKRKVPSTLLQKLLHNEIRQERNIVLQCIRYIKKNNYFEKSSQ